MNKPPPLNMDYKRDPNIWALKRRGFINHGSTLVEEDPFKAIMHEPAQTAQGLGLRSKRTSPRSYSDVLLGKSGLHYSGLMQP